MRKTLLPICGCFLWQSQVCFRISKVARAAGGVSCAKIAHVLRSKPIDRFIDHQSRILVNKVANSFPTKTLFFIYINDLPTAVQGSTVSMYVDDTSLCLKSRDISQLNEAINDDLAHLDSWLKGNKLSLNVAKTQSMLIATKPKHRTLNNAAEKLHLKILGSELDVVNKTKYLRVHVDNSLDL